jgi:hypothetical protein
MRRRLLPIGSASVRVLVLVVLVALAGCSGFAGGGASTDGASDRGPASGDGSGEGEGARSGAEAGTAGDPGSEAAGSVTPVPVPAVQRTETPAPRVAPGLSATGVTNASALAAAHGARLANTSYTMVRNVTYLAANGTKLTERRSVSEVGTDGRFAVRRTREGVRGPAREALWSNGTALFEARTDTEGTTAYRRAAPEVAERRRALVTDAGSWQIERVFTVAEARVVDRTERSGTTVYRLESPVAQLPNANASDVGASVRVEAAVTEGGLVREYAFRQTFSGDSSGAASVVVATRYTDIGETTVSRPPWYDEALTVTNGSGTNDSAVNRSGADGSATTATGGTATNGTATSGAEIDGTATDETETSKPGASGSEASGAIERTEANAATSGSGGSDGSVASSAERW